MQELNLSNQKKEVPNQIFTQDIKNEIENVENEEDPYANEYDLWLITEKGYVIENAKRDSGVGMNRMFSYLYYFIY